MRDDGRGTKGRGTKDDEIAYELRVHRPSERSEWTSIVHPHFYLEMT